MTTFTPTHDVVTEATAAGFFPPRHNVEITQVTAVSYTHLTLPTKLEV